MTNRNWWDNRWDRPYERDDPQQSGAVLVHLAALRVSTDELVGVKA
jgi:hypothetical protein